MKYLLLLLSSWLLVAPALAQPLPERSGAQLWRALRAHPQADRQHVDLLNELADEENYQVDGLGHWLMSNQLHDSLTTTAYTLARQLHYTRGELYAATLNPLLIVPYGKNKHFDLRAYCNWMEQKCLPQAERLRAPALMHVLLIQLIFYDAATTTKKKGLYIQRLVAAARAAHSPRTLCHAYRAQGFYYRDRGDYQQCLQSFFLQLRTAQLAGLTDEECEAFSSLADFYITRNDKSLSLYYAQLALRSAAKVTPASYRSVLKQSSLVELGIVYYVADDYSRALLPLQQATKLNRLDTARSLDAKCIIAAIYERQHNALTLPYVRQLLHLALKRRWRRHYSSFFLTVGRYYLRTGQADSAIVNGRLALHFHFDQDDEIDATQLLTQAYALKGNYAQAYAYQRRYLGLHDTLQGAQTTRRVTALRFEQDLAQQRSRIGLLTRNQQLQATAAQRQRWLLGAALLGVLLLAGLALVFWRGNRQQRRANTLLASQKQQLAEQAERLGELDEAKNQFFANVSHELRTPLTLVLGPLEALLSGPAPALPPAARQPVALAHHQAQRLLQLVNRILDLTKLQAGRLSLHPVPTDLAGLLQRVIAQFESLAAQRGIGLAGPPGLPAELPLLLDGEKVEEVLTNLLINALNHTPAGGQVWVTLALPSPADEQQYAVRVQDTGPGIAEAEQARVFERFYQSPQAHAQGGTGLGLALSRELATLLGGALTLVSAAGQGAAFTLRFPARALPLGAVLPPAAAPLPAPALPVPVGNAPRPRVLVVEDNPDLRAYLGSLLAPAYEVLLAEDGQAALELLAREQPVDLLATDAMMPRLSGLQLLERLRADPAYQNVPVLMLTARADDAHRQAALTVGVDDYLTKPFATAELLARVRALLARYQVRQHFATLPPAEAEPAAEVAAAAPSAGADPAGQPGVVAPATRRRLAVESVATQLAQWQAQVATRLADEQFGPAELAELLCLSERTLYRRLGELAGLTPAAWLRELRLDKARQLLEAGGFGSVAAVADAVGFASPKYFAALYTERFGRRPSDYCA